MRVKDVAKCKGLVDQMLAHFEEQGRYGMSPDGITCSYELGCAAGCLIPESTRRNADLMLGGLDARREWYEHGKDMLGHLVESWEDEFENEGYSYVPGSVMEFLECAQVTHDKYARDKLHLSRFMDWLRDVRDDLKTMEV